MVTEEEAKVNPSGSSAIPLGGPPTGAVPPTIIERVSVKMPQFSKDDIEFFFWQAEASFALSGVTAEATRFHYAVTAIPQEVLRDVAEIIRNPPDNPYTKVKERLLSIYADTKEQRIRRVLQDVALGDRKPTALLRDMEHHAQGKLLPPVMRTIFMSRLPDDVQKILAASSSPIGELAIMADKIMDVGPARSVASASVALPAAPSAVSDLVNEVRELRREVASLRQNQNWRSRGRSASPHPNRTRDRSRSQRKFETCWYHYKFGDDARTCRDFCKRWSEFCAKSGDKPENK